MPGKYGSLNLLDDEQEDGNNNIQSNLPGHAHFAALKAISVRHSQGNNDDEDNSGTNKEDRISVVVDGIPLPLNLAPLLKRLSDSKYDDDDLSDDDILSSLFIIRIAEALHR